MNQLRIGAGDYGRLHAHLFQPDRDEHGALLLAGQHHRLDGSVTLSVREVHLLQPDDFPPGVHGYRQISAASLARLGNRAADQNLALISAHSHPGSDERTGLSRDDLAAHERLFTHLLDITAADAVCGVAFGRRSAAGELWRADGRREPLDLVRIVGPNLEQFQMGPHTGGARAEGRFDRQIRLFGADGQARLRNLHVGVVGAGGGGSILIEQLAHLGVGEITAVDPDVTKEHNLSRIMGASPRDARKHTKKVQLAKRLAGSIDPKVRFHAIEGDVADRVIAQRLLDCDYLFMATDTATARLVVNAIGQSYLIPVIQIGAKVETRSTGAIEQIYTAVRPVLPRRGCLACAGLIDPMQLQHEAATAEERNNQNYLGLSDIIDPSVTTLNAAAAAGALNVFLMGVIGQADDELLEHRITLTRDGSTLATEVERDLSCRWCGEHDRSRYGRSDLDLLPCRAPGSSGSATPAVRRRALLPLRRWPRGA